MRVLVLSTSFPRWAEDWAGSFVLRLALELARRAEVRVLTPGFPGGPPSEERDGLAIRRFSYFRPRRMQRVLYPDGIPDQLKKSWLARLQLPLFLVAFVAATVRESRRHDVLLCNWAITGLVARVAGWLTRRPYLVVLRGSDVQLIERGGILGRLLLAGVSGARGACVVAEDFVATLARHGIPNASFTPNGIDTERFSQDRAEARSGLGLGDEKLVLYAGSLIERKGVRYLVEAMRGVEARLAIVGAGPEEPTLRRLADEAGVAAHFAGLVPHREMPRWFAAADLFVLPSLYEGRANVLMEALASQTPCIATDIQGSRELIRDAVNGFLVKPRDADELRARIQQVLGDDALRGRLASRAAAVLSESVPSWEACADRYLRLLEGVV